MKIKEVKGKVILDSRKEKTIEVSVKTDWGIFSASSPSGKSKGKNETPAFIGSAGDCAKKIINLSDKISKLNIEEFKDLEEVEKIIEKKETGANTLFAFETAILKALATEQEKELWQVINEKARKFPFPVGNCIGGGLHSAGKKPDFQEFLIIPKTKKFVDNFFLLKEGHKICGEILKLRKARNSVNDENAWATSLGNEEVLDILNKVREELEGKTEEKIGIGIDIASNSFFSGFYSYKNPARILNEKKQKEYVKSLIEKYRISYVEDPFYEEDFESFAELREEIMKKSPCLVVGDDLISSQVERLKRALRKRNINAVIVKPNQNGSLLEIKKLVELAKKFEIVTIMSHRSGETLDYALADLAFAFQTDFIKAGIIGKEREIKLKRLVDIEKNFA